MKAWSIAGQLRVVESAFPARIWHLIGLCVWKGMPKAPSAKIRQRSEEEILDQATRQLLKATKEEAKKKEKPVNEESLRRDGYSDQFIEKVRDA